MLWIQKGFCTSVGMFYDLLNTRQYLAGSGSTLKPMRIHNTAVQTLFIYLFSSALRIRSSISSESGFGSRVLMTKKYKKKIQLKNFSFLNKNCNSQLFWYCWHTQQKAVFLDSHIRMWAACWAAGCWAHSRAGWSRRGRAVGPGTFPRRWRRARSGLRLLRQLRGQLEICRKGQLDRYRKGHISFSVRYRTTKSTYI